ncbi:MAG: hypothetical protein ACR2QW_09295 [bacterium]
MNYPEAATMEIRFNTLTEQLDKEHAMLSERLDKVTSLKARLKDNPEMAAILDSMAELKLVHFGY